MKRNKFIVFLLTLFVGGFSCAAADWTGAVYGVLSGTDTATTRTISYYDANGILLGSQSMATSNFVGANAIAYGSTVCPNLGEGGKGLVLLRTEVGSATETSPNAGRTINFYVDPVTATGASLARTTPSTYGTVSGPALASPAIDHYVDLVVAKNGSLLALVNRKNETTGAITGVYLYPFAIPETHASYPNLNRENDTYFNQLLNISNIETTAVATGDFLKNQTYDNQFALVDINGLLTIRNSTYGSSQATQVATGFTPFDISLGKDIVSIWESDYNYLAVLYDDNSVVEWDVATATQKNTFTFAGLTNALDVVRFTALIPEPSAYAAIFGFAALALVFLKRRRK